MIAVGPFRFFSIVAPAPWWMRIAFGAAVLMGAVTLLQDPREIDSALALVLLLQMFAAAGGFNMLAARGYFDPLLVSGRTRRSIAFASLAVSTLPGIAAWTAIVAIAAAAGGGERAFALQRHVALVVVSSIAWALGVVLPRTAPGVLWCAALLAFALGREAFTSHIVLAQSAPAGVHGVLMMTAACVVCPFLLLGDAAGPRNGWVLSLLTAAVVVVTAAGIRRIQRQDFVLVETA